MADFYYPQSGEPKPVYFDAIGKSPESEEATKLVTLPFEKKPLSSEELKDALKWFFIGIAVAVGLWFFGRWVINNFVGLGIIFFGYGGAYLGAPVSVIFGLSSLFKIFRSGRKKKAEDSLKWVWQTSFLGEDAVGKRFGKLEYALGTIERAVPAGIPFDREQLKGYITGLRETLGRAMDETTLPAREEKPGGWSEGGAVKSIVIEGSRELYPGVSELSATVTFKDVITRSGADNKAYNVISAIVEIHIKNTFIRSGKYWFPYDLTPAVTRCDPPPAAVEDAKAFAAAN